MPSTLEAPAFVAPKVSRGKSVLFNNGSRMDLWVPAIVTRVGAGGGLELMVFGHDGGVDVNDQGAANVALEMRDNVLYVDDPKGQTEQYQIHVIGDGYGGYWKLTDDDVETTERLDKLEKQVADLLKASRGTKTTSSAN